MQVIIRLYQDCVIKLEIVAILLVSFRDIHEPMFRSLRSLSQYPWYLRDIFLRIPVLGSVLRARLRFGTLVLLIVQCAMFLGPHLLVFNTDIHYGPPFQHHGENSIDSVRDTIDQNGLHTSDSDCNFSMWQLMDPADRIKIFVLLWDIILVSVDAGSHEQSGQWVLQDTPLLLPLSSSTLVSQRR